MSGGPPTATAIAAVTFDYWNTLVWEERGPLRGRRQEAWAGLLEDAGFAVERDALDAGATAITEGMKLAAAEAIASAVPEAELAPSYIVPSVFNKKVVELVAERVAAVAVQEGVVRPDARSTR